MESQKRIENYGIKIGNMSKGYKNKITDVPGVKVGHVTINNSDAKTGVTAILPHGGNLFKNKVIAGTYTINGFGKTMGLTQIEELGTIETPIILTNTLSIGVASDGLINYMLDTNEDIGIDTGTVNPVVCECNDGYLNEIREGHVKKEDVYKAIEVAGLDFEEGSVGAGTGMSCYKLKGGIGSASRIVNLDERSYTVGALVMTNMGKKRDFIINGQAVGKRICEIDKKDDLEDDKGSIIIIIATDIPMTQRQLKRISKRSIVGLSRTGSYIGNGSGEIVIAFSTEDNFEHYGENGILNVKKLNENYIDLVFRAVAESVEEAILNSLITANETVAKNGNIRYSLKKYIKDVVNI